MSGYLLPFELVSVHLLVVLVGAASLGSHETKSPTAAKSHLARRRVEAGVLERVDTISIIVRWRRTWNY